MTHATTTTLFALLASTTLAAQTVSLTSLNPIIATAAVTGQPQTATLAAGPLPSQGSLTASQGTSAAQYASITAEWHLIASDHRVVLDLRQRAFAASTGPLVTSLTPGNFLLQVANPTPVLAVMELTRSPLVPAGAAIRVLEVDIGNDGSVDFSATSPNSSLTLTVTIGPVPLPIRLHNELSTQGQANIDMGMNITILPTPLISATPAGAGCSFGHSQQLLPTFAGNLRAFTIGPLTASFPSVTVFGWQAQPTLLPTPQPGPCILVPTPDVLVLSTWQGFTVPLPPTVRPVTFWTQAVVFEPEGLTTTPASRIDAL